MNHASLFSGIGGFDLAAGWMGWENVFHCEWNPFGQRVLNYYWPNATSYGDITQTDFTIWRNRIDVLTGGFPCQPYSLAGKRLGKEDERHLWPEMLRAIREIQPRWVVGENVFGLINWNGGLVFDEVQSDLEAQGYDVQPYVLPACGVNAPHRRDRVWFVAHAKSDGGNRASYEASCKIKGQDRHSSKQFTERRKVWDAAHPNSDGLFWSNSEHEEYAGEGGEYAQRDIEPSPDNGFSSYTECAGLQGRKVNGGTASDWSERDKQPTRLFPPDWENFPTQSPICCGNDGFPCGLAGITVSKHRNESIKAYGNAIVPQVVSQIFKTIQLYEQ